MASQRKIATGAKTQKPGLVRNAFNKVSSLPAYRTLTEQWKRR